MTKALQLRILKPATTESSYDSFFSLSTDLTPGVFLEILVLDMTKFSRKHKNLLFFLFSLGLAFGLSRFEAFHTLLLSLGNFGYVSAFFAGMLFISTFTVSTGALMLLILAARLTAWEIGLIAGVGAVVGDVIIFRFVQDDLLRELKDIYAALGGNHLNHVLHTKYFSWTLPVIGALIIASPLPDELGVSLLGISKMKTWKFLIISFILNATGIFLIVTATNFVKP